MGQELHSSYNIYAFLYICFLEIARVIVFSASLPKPGKVVTSQTHAHNNFINAIRNSCNYSNLVHMQKLLFSRVSNIIRVKKLELKKDTLNQTNWWNRNSNSQDEKGEEEEEEKGELKSKFF